MSDGRSLPAGTAWGTNCVSELHNSMVDAAAAAVCPVFTPSRIHTEAPRKRSSNLLRAELRAQIAGSPADDAINAAHRPAVVLPACAARAHVVRELAARHDRRRASVARKRPMARRRARGIMRSKNLCTDTT